MLFADETAALLEAREAIEGWLAEHRGLVLNGKRWHVSATSQPCTYLGQRVSRAGLSPGQKLRRRLPKKVRAAAERGDEALVCSIRLYDLRGVCSATVRQRLGGNHERNAARCS